MTDPITFTVPGLPVGQPRQRHRLAKSKSGQMFTRNYIPGDDPIHDFKSAVKFAALQAFGNRPLLTGPLAMRLTFRLKRNKGETKKRSDNPPLYATRSPDFDNLAKGVCDALNAVVWNDDAQIAEASITKLVAAASESPGVDVEIWQLDNEELADSWRANGKMF